MFTAIAADHVQRPRNRGELQGATHYGVAGSPGGGPYVQIWLNIVSGVVQNAAYETHGCPSSVAAASVLCQIVIGRTADKLGLIEAGDLLLVLGGLPEGKETLANLAVNALRDATEVGAP